MSLLQSLEQGNHRLICPACADGSRKKNFSVTVEHDGAAVGHCFRCEYVENCRPQRGIVQRFGKALNRPVAARKREGLSDYGLTLFDACVALRGTVGGSYLLARGCALPPQDGDLRFHHALRHPVTGYVGPALVALVTHAETRAPLTLHRTWVQADGQKAHCDPPRMLLGAHPKKHGVIRLWPDEYVTYGLAVAEGIESALALAKSYTPVWACIDAGNLAELPAMRGIETLIIGADHDPAGLKAATACADRWAAAGVDVRVIAPGAERADWADLGVAA